MFKPAAKPIGKLSEAISEQRWKAVALTAGA
jgi:hypothetical protein